MSLTAVQKGNVPGGLRLIRLAGPMFVAQAYPVEDCPSRGRGSSKTTRWASWEAASEAAVGWNTATTMSRLVVPMGLQVAWHGLGSQHLLIRAALGAKL